MSAETNVNAQTAFGDAIVSGDLESFRDLVTEDCVDHDPAPGQAPGPQGYIDFFTDLRTAFPDLGLEVEHMTVTEDDVAFAYTISGTHRGPFLGFAPTGKRMSARGMQIGRFEDGRMAERWGATDLLSILTQLGLAPDPEA